MKNIWMSSDGLKVAFLLREISRAIGLFGMVYMQDKQAAQCHECLFTII